MPPKTTSSVYSIGKDGKVIKNKPTEWERLYERDERGRKELASVDVFKDIREERVKSPQKSTADIYSGLLESYQSNLKVAKQAGSR